MKRNDRFLLGIVIGVIALIVVGFATAFLRPKPSYRAEDRPEGVAYNYLLALQQGDYTRAYTYLAPTIKGYPKTVEAFARDVGDASFGLRVDTNVSALEIDSTRVTNNVATVTVRETYFNQGGPFNTNQYSTKFDMQLQRDGEVWHITDSNSYWVWCWHNANGCQ